MAGVLSDDALVAWRGLMRRPFYAVATVVMLALAIGANAVAFGLFYGFLIRPLPYRDAERLFVVRESSTAIPGAIYAEVSSSAYRTIRHAVPQFADSGVWTNGGAAPVTIAHRPKAVRYSRATPSLFRTLGVVPLLGRLPSLAAGRPGGPAELVISARFWRKVYGGSDDVLDRRLTMNGVDYRIVGVLPPDYAFGARAEVVLPLVLPVAGLREQNFNDVMVIRRPDGVSLLRADSLLRDALPRVRARMTPQFAAMGGAGLALEARKLRPSFTAGSSLSILPWILQGTALLLLVLAVANAANLALVRHRGRIHEFTLRRVLGGSGAALMRLLVLEQVPLLGVIGAIGVGLAWAGTRLILSYGSAIQNPPFRFGFGWDQVVCVLVLAVGSLAAVSAAPIIQTVRLDLTSAIGQGSKATLGRAARLTQRGLGMAQIALAVALLAGSLTLTVSLNRFLNQPLGFTPDHRLVADVLAPKTTDMATAIGPVIARLESQPYVVSATGAGFDTVPFSHSNANVPIRRMAPGSKLHNINVALAGDHFMATMGMRMLAGRRLRPLDQGHEAKVVVLGAGVARRLFGTTNVVGRMVQVVLLGDFRVVGVARPVVWRSTPWGQTFGTVYVPATAFAIPAYPVYVADIIVRYRGSARAAARDVRRVIEAAVPGAVVNDVRPYGTVIARYMAFRRMAAAIVSVFAVLALILAALGVYAVNAFIARARLPEFGMRAMLGASSGRLLWLALRDAAWLLAVGLVGGLVGGFLLVRAMSPLLFHEDAIAPAMFALSVGLIAVIVLGAAWRPASRAARMPVKRLLDAG